MPKIASREKSAALACLDRRDALSYGRAAQQLQLMGGLRFIVCSSNAIAVCSLKLRAGR